MTINKKFLLFQIILYLFSLFKCEFYDDAQGMKVVACMNIIEKRFKNVESDQSYIYSSSMLACFMQITDAQSEKVISDFETGEISFDVNEIDDLINTDFLKSVPEEEIQKKSIELENIIQEFQKFDDEFSQLKEGKINNNNDKKDKDSDSKMKKINDFLKLDFDNSLLIALLILVIIIFIMIKTGITPEKEVNKNFKNFKLEEKEEKKEEGKKVKEEEKKEEIKKEKEKIE